MPQRASAEWEIRLTRLLADEVGVLLTMSGICLRTDLKLFVWLNKMMAVNDEGGRPGGHPRPTVLDRFRLAARIADG
jgi:hypothetical protein